MFLNIISITRFYHMFGIPIMKIVWVTHYVIAVLDSRLARITRMPRMICGSLGFEC